jgi:hypothetical protein
VLEQKVQMLEQGDIGAELVALVQRAGTLNSPGADNQLSTTGANMALFLNSQTQELSILWPGAHAPLRSSTNISTLF